VAEAWALVESEQTTYLQSGTILTSARESCTVGKLAPVEQPLVLRLGDTLIVRRDAAPGHAGSPAEISCTLPQVFADVKRGDRIWFDDGAIGGRVTEACPDRLTVEISSAAPNGSRLRADKGINLPDTNLRLPPLASHDEVDLAFIAAHADLVGYSFVRRPSDVVELQDRPAELARPARSGVSR
jgi:pyruvate kinase